MRELLYLSTKKLGTFMPDRPSLSVQGAGSASVGPVAVKVDVSTTSPAGFDEATIKSFRRVVGHLEREAGSLTSPDLVVGQWISFNIKMGYGTVYRDTGLLPPADDVALFYGSHRSDEPGGHMSTDLLLCGSTEHLLRRTASAGRMGSGTEWLHDLIGRINSADSVGDGELPEEVRPNALAVKRTNMPTQVARWTFDVIWDHHSPDQYARLKGLAKVLLVVPENEIVNRLVLATPLFVEFASAKPLGPLGRLRMRRELARIHGVGGRRWQPQLSPTDRARVYVPVTERGKGRSGSAE
jgi:Family of unknown function (DUF7019)